MPTELLDPLGVEASHDDPLGLSSTAKGDPLGLETREPGLYPAAKESPWSRASRKVRESLSPLIGPTEEQRWNQATGLDSKGQPIYKPAGSKIEQEGLFPAASHPLVPIPSATQEAVDRMTAAPMAGIWADPRFRDSQKEAAATAAIYNAVKGFAEFGESPLGIATAGAGAAVHAGRAPAALGRIISGGYAADMAGKVPEMARQAGETSVTGTPLQKAEANIGLASQIGLAGTLGAHALAPGAGAASPAQRDVPDQPFTINLPEVRPEAPQAAADPLGVEDVPRGSIPPAQPEAAQPAPHPAAAAIDNLSAAVADLKAALTQNQITPEKPNEPSAARQPGSVPGQHEGSPPLGEESQGSPGLSGGNEPARAEQQGRPEAQTPTPGVNEARGGESPAAGVVRAPEPEPVPEPAKPNPKPVETPEDLQSQLAAELGQETPKKPIEAELLTKAKSTLAKVEAAGKGEGEQAQRLRKTIERLDYPKITKFSNSVLGKAVITKEPAPGAVDSEGYKSKQWRVSYFSDTGTAIKHTSHDTWNEARQSLGREWKKEATVESAAIETDQAKRQEIQNSVDEGQMILKSGKTVAGRKMQKEELAAVQRSVDKAKAKLGTVPEGAKSEPTSQPGRVGRGVSARSVFDRETQATGPDLLDWIVQNGRMMSRSAAKIAMGKERFNANKSLWDDAPALQKPHHNKIYGGREKPDQVAQRAFEEGLIKEPSTNALWRAVDGASKRRANALESAKREERFAREEADEHERWLAATKAGEKRVNASDLTVGDMLEVDGERVKVVDIDPDTGDVTVQDGRKFGKQVIKDGSSFYVEKIDPAPEDTHWPTIEPEESPKLRAGEKHGELLQGQDQPFNLAGEKGTDFDRVAAEKSKAAQTSQEATALDAKQQQGLFSKGEAWADKKISDAQGRLSTGLDPELLTAYGIKGAAHIARGVRDFAAWSAEMVKEFGEKIKPHLEKVWTEALKVRRGEVGTRLGEIADQNQPHREISDELKSERFQLSKEHRQIGRELARNPEHVADLLRKLDGLGREMENARKAGNGLKVREMGEEMRAIMDGDLPMVPPDLLARVYNDLVARREIMGTKGGELPSGRTLGDFTAWLKAQKKDSPNLTLFQRLNLSQRFADEFSKGKSAFLKTVDKATAAWEAFVTQYKAPLKDDDYRTNLKNFGLGKEWTGIDSHVWSEEAKRQVPNDNRRRALALWVDAHGDENLLRAQADAIIPEYKPLWQIALKLTDGEKRIGREMIAELERKLEDGQNTGLIEKGRKDYGMPQQWEVNPKTEGEYDPFAKRVAPPRNPRANLDPRDPFFALPRNTPSYFDGIMAGGKPKNLDAAKLIAFYNEQFHEALLSRDFIKRLSDSKAEDGTPVVQISGSVMKEARENGKVVYFADSTRRPKDAVTADGRPYERVDHWALKKWKIASKDTQSNPIVVHGDFLVHPDFAERLRNELGTSMLRDRSNKVGRVVGPILNFASGLKSAKFASASFHMVTEAIHSVFHGVAPITKGIDLDLGRNPKLGALVRNGLDLGFSGQRTMMEEGLTGRGGLWGHVPGVGDALTKMSDYMFKDYIPKLKAKVGLTVLERNTRRYSNELTSDQIHELTAQQVNAAFGGQNWRLLGTNKTMLDFARLAFVAPDFLLSRSKVAAQALKPYGREQRYFLLAQAAFVYGAARTLNTLLDDDPHFEAENADSVVYKGRAYRARFLVSDLWHLATDPASFAQGRLGPLPRIGIETATGRDMRTGARIDVPLPTDNKALRAAEVMFKGGAQWLIPVGAEGFLPGASGNEQTRGGQAALGLLGVGSRKFTAQTQVYNMANNWSAQQADAHDKLIKKMKDDAVGGEGPYRKLDALLEAGDDQAAAKEYQALVAEGHTEDAIEKRYSSTERPFTGSNDREDRFLASLTPHQREIYNRAIKEREERLTKFEKMMDKMTVGR